MQLKQIKLVNFRNYEEELFNFTAKVVLVVGDNGMGKTNLLDAIYYSSIGKSYFTSYDKNVTLQNQAFFRIESKFDLYDEQLGITIKVKPGTLKEIEVNNNKITKLSEHIGKVPIVMISPDDVHTLLQSNEERRNFINNIIVQYDPIYIEQLTLYNRLLKQRNALLKEYVENRKIDNDLLWVITKRMANPAKYIFTTRRNLIDDLKPFFKTHYSEISNSNEHCTIDYISQLDQKDFLHQTDYAMEKDKATGRSSVGVHKDEIIFLLNDMPLKDYGSQGQLKTFVLALKLSQYQYLSNNTNIKPLLLLDDIFDKLDPSRVQHLLELIKQNKFGQVFITDTHVNRIKDLLNDQEMIDVFEIKHGKIFR